MRWVNANDAHPNNNEKVLTAQLGYGCLKTVYFDVAYYSDNLESVDEYDFQDEKRPGFYKYDSEIGYYEMVHVLYWMKIPPLPDEALSEFIVI